MLMAPPGYQKKQSPPTVHDSRRQTRACNRANTKSQHQVAAGHDHLLRLEDIIDLDNTQGIHRKRQTCEEKSKGQMARRRNLCSCHSHQRSHRITLHL